MAENSKSLSAPSQRALVRAKQKARRLRKAGERETLFELIVAGYSYAAIAKEKGVCEATVRREVQRALKTRKSDAPERYVALQKARLDRPMPGLVQLLAESDRYEGFSARLSCRPEPQSEVSADWRHLAPKRLISADSKTALRAPVAASPARGRGG